ncbi:MULTISPECIES: acyloxyacyl hydrolase [unclassified Roseitalea]|uniref:acyloxyacyl hydrolase n=1 Tax=unclassified Roseitalea TaxID=2639107 RepID=UPI00273F546E|nr:MULTISPECIES: acyloxyacyl hydrolase [unclassified Roseitalea]
MGFVWTHMRWAAAIVLGFTVWTTAAGANEVPRSGPVLGKHADRMEIRFGGALHDRGFLTVHEADGFVVNGELLFRSPDLLARLGAPRPYIGASYAFVEDGATPVQFIYAGLNWQVHWTERVYTGFSLGGAVNDADLSAGSPNWGLGCNASFHLAASAGVDLTDRVSVEIFGDHFSNAELCFSNGGHETAGMRIGVRF